MIGIPGPRPDDDVWIYYNPNVPALDYSDPKLREIRAKLYEAFNIPAIFREDDE